MTATEHRRPIQVTFQYATGAEAGTLRLDHVPRVGDHVLWLTDVTEQGKVFEHDVEYPVTGVQWMLHADAALGGFVYVHLGPATTGP